MALLKDKVVVITGGAGRLGRVFAQAVLNAGGSAVLADVPGALDAAHVSALIAASPERSMAHAVDITDAASLRSLLAAVVGRFGRVDALVNNAYPRNPNYGRKFEEVTYADFVENVGMHAGGYFLASQCFLEHFRKQGHGNIVNMSSIYGVVAPRFNVYEGTDMTMPVEYALIKSGIIHLTKYIASYHRGMGIRCNCISPGGIKADQPDAFLARYNAMGTNKGMLDPEDVSGVLVFLLSDLSAYVNGQNILVDDGWSL